MKKPRPSITKIIIEYRKGLWEYDIYFSDNTSCGANDHCTCFESIFDLLNWIQIIKKDRHYDSSRI